MKVASGGATAARRTGASAARDARARVLEVATELVSLRGLEGVTVREITDACGVNVATVSYYFGSKEGLLKQVMLEVFAPVRSARSDGLARLLDAYAPGPAPVPEIMRALIRPLVEAPRSRDGSRTIIRMMQHLRANQDHTISHFVLRHYDYGAQGFIDALAHAMPGLMRPEIIWRYEFARGAAIHMLTICDPLSIKLAVLADGRAMVDIRDNEVVLREIMQCVLLGLSAPAAWTAADMDERY
jgi:AcrR family transcriptional regulator